MGRLGRVIAVGVAHHVTQRGNGRRFLLESGADRRGETKSSPEARAMSHGAEDLFSGSPSHTEGEPENLLSFRHRNRHCLASAAFRDPDRVARGLDCGWCLKAFLNYRDAGLIAFDSNH